MNTLGNYITEYLEYCEYRKHLNVKSLKAYKIDLKQYDTFSCDLPEYLSRNTLDSFLTNLHKQYKPKTVKRKIAIKRYLFHHLVQKNFPLLLRDQRLQFMIIFQLLSTGYKQ